MCEIMNIAIHIRQGLSIKEIINKLNEIIDFNVVSQDPDYVLSFGGDGTFLDALKLYGTKPIYIPINMGTLGFYSSWNGSDFSEILKDSKFNNIVYAPMLDIYTYTNGQESKLTCLNEATIINPFKTQILKVFVDGSFIESFRGTGVCISTPTGSTAYNKSLGGAIISSSKRLFQLTNIAPISNVKYRSLGNPVILDEYETLRFEATREQMEDSILTVDRQIVKLDDVDSIEIKMSKETIQILVPPNNNFYDRVRSAFIDSE